MISLLRPGHWWWRAQRDFKRGMRSTVGDYFTGPKIWRWRNPFATTTLQSVPIALVLGHEHVTMAAWMLASWTVVTGRNWQIVLHDDGTLPADTIGRLHHLGLDVTLVSRAEGNVRTAAALATCDLCRRYREQYPLGLKLIDAPLLQSSDRFILLDPDVLFFRPPSEIIRWVDDVDDLSCWFNADVAEASNVPAAEARNRLGVSLWPRVNSGLCLLTRKAIDLDFCERALHDTGILSGHFWRVEQTLFALCASRLGRGGLLPSSYEVTLAPHLSPGAVARHYVGAVREKFWGEGVPRIARSILSR